MLVATNVTGFQHATLVESALAIALTLRGAQVDLMACDAALPACLKVEHHAIADPQHVVGDRLPELLCGPCYSVGRAHFEPLGLEQPRFSEFLTPADRAVARDHCASLDRASLPRATNDAGDPIGMHGLAGCLRYYARAELPEGSQSEALLRRFVEAAMLTTIAFERLLAARSYEVAVFHHGIYVPQGPAGDVLRRHDVRVVNWNPSYRRSTFIFSHGDSYHHTLLEEPTQTWEQMPWSEAQEADILDYLDSRTLGSRDWIWFHEKPDSDAASFSRDLGIDPDKPIIGMLSNVAWDAQLHFPANAFPGMLDWVFETIEYFAARPELQLLLRVHPAEIRGTVTSQQPLVAEISRRWPVRPANVFVIPPESNVSTYAAMALCDSVIIFGTKTGVELTARGTPVVVAGEAWIRNKRLTRDATDAADYRRILDELPAGTRLDGRQLERARRYAYHFFFRRMIPLPFIVPAEDKLYRLDLAGIDELRPGSHAGLDVVCDGILTATPFVYEAERLGLHA